MTTITNAAYRRAKIVLNSEAIFSLEMFFSTIMAPFYLNHIGVTFEEMSLFFSCIMILNWIFEVPGGVFADVYGRKFSFVIGKVIYLLAMISLFYVKSFSALLLVAPLFSIGISISSGNLSSLIFEQLSALGKQDCYFSMSAQASSIAFFSAALACIVGGALGDIDLKIPLMIDCVALGITIVISTVMLGGEDVGRSDRNRLRPTINDAMRVLRTGINSIRGNRLILFFILLSALNFATLRSSFNFYQPIMEELRVSLPQFGLVMACLNASAAVFAALASRMQSSLFRGFLASHVTSCMLMASAILMLLSHQYPILAFLVLILHQGLRAIVDPYARANINQLISSGNESRTTILSAMNMCRALLAATVTALSGTLATTVGLTNAFSAISFLASVIIVILFVFAVMLPARVRS